MANVHPKHTGLSRWIWILEGWGSSEKRPHIIIERKGGSPDMLMSIEEEPEIFGSGYDNISDTEMKPLKEWIILNKNLLLSYWYQHGQYRDTKSTLDALKRI